jgi:hypothetical protein
MISETVSLMKNEDRATENFCFIALALIWEDAIRPKLGYQIFLSGIRMFINLQAIQEGKGVFDNKKLFRLWRDRMVKFESAYSIYATEIARHVTHSIHSTIGTLLIVGFCYKMNVVKKKLSHPILCQISYCQGPQNVMTT